VAGTIDHRRDADYFRVPLEAGTKYEISVRSESDQVIFALLTEAFCAVEGPGVWEKTYDTWVLERSEDYWVRVAFGRSPSEEPEAYTLVITARGDDFLTIEERATQLQPNVVQEVGPDGDGGNNLYRVRLDHPRYVIEVTGGPSAWGISSGEQFGGSYVDELTRYVYAIPSNPPVDYSFRVSGGANGPYTVVAREYVPADEDLDWSYVNMSPGFPPGYCTSASGEQQ